MKVEFSKYRKWILVKIVGRIDSFTYQLLENELQVLLRTGAKYIIIDFSENTYFNLSAFRLLKDTYQKLSQVNGKLTFVAPSKEIIDQLDYFLPKEEINIKENVQDIGET